MKPRTVFLLLTMVLLFSILLSIKQLIQDKTTLLAWRVSNVTEECVVACPHCEKERLNFIKRHTKYCSKNLNPPLIDNKTLCEFGYEKLDVAMPTMGELRDRYRGIIRQGHWSPPSCTPRQRVAIIIPCRDREEHLKILLNRLLAVLIRQQIYFQIFVVEQVFPDLFNKASMMNIAYIQAKQQENFDCYVFHDVDMLPENDYNIYTCLDKSPRHVGAYLDKFGYILKYRYNFGGVTAFTGQQFEKVNGFSNLFYGWGGEDDDMFHRVRKSKLWIDRYPATIARYTMIKHTRDKKNPVNKKRYRMVYADKRDFRNQGLNTLHYHNLSVITKSLYKLGSAIGYMFLIPTNFPTIVYRPPKIHVVYASIQDPFVEN